MVNPIVGQTADTPTATERELRIVMNRDHSAVFEGSAAQLVEEGLIPAGFAWPPKREGKRWQANGFDCFLFRIRPEGLKGPMRVWIEMDHWRLRLEVVGRDNDWHQQRWIQRKNEEVAARIYNLSHAGYVEWLARDRRFCESLRDKQFQAFKALVPGLVQPRRGRKPKAAQRPA